MLRIAHIVRRFVFEEWGGTETVVWNTALNQKTMGLDPEILATSALSNTGEELRNGIRIRRFPYFYPYFPMPKKDLLALDKKGGSPFSFGLFHTLRQSRYDLIHIHCGGRLAATCAKIARRQKIPSLITLHGGMTDVPETEMQELLRPFRGKIPYGRLLDWCCGTETNPTGLVDAFLCVSRAETKRLVKQYPQKRVYYLPNGIQLERFATNATEEVRTKYAIPQDRRLILCVSRIDYQKNQKILLELLKRTKDTHLLLIGPVTALWYRDELLEEVATSGLSARFTLIPGVPPDSPLLISALHAADVFVLPSLHEPFGIAALEAWAAGVPLIAANVGGLKDFIHDRIDGLFFDPKSAETLMDAWQYLQKPGVKPKLVRNAQKEVEKYNWPILVHRLLEIYRETQNGIR